MSLTDGIGSVLNGTDQSSSLRVAGTPSGSAAASSYSLGGIGEVVGAVTGIKSLVDKPKSGAEAGREQFDFMKAAYPKLNPWEAAGASSQAGNAAVTAETAKQQQRNDLAKMTLQGNIQSDIVDKQTASQERVARIQEGSSRFATETGSTTQMRNVDAQLSQTFKKQQREIALIEEQIKTEAGAKSGAGKMFKDIGTATSGITGRLKSNYDKASEDTSYKEVLERKLDALRKSWSDTKSMIKGRFNTRGIQSQVSPDTNITDEEKFNKYMKSIRK
ncbi:MAG: DNA pilot protein [Microviridae sp.]|nr:MAG: DNA pilot protein [Microviridae sp.]